MLLGFRANRAAFPSATRHAASLRSPIITGVQAKKNDGQPFID